MIFHQSLHSETQHPFWILSENYDLIHAHEKALLEADKIVGAQFYYTNPLVYVFLSPEKLQADTEKHAALWGSYHLLNIKSYDKLVPLDNVMGINHVFIEQIGSALLSTKTDIDLSDFSAYHNKYGLYMVGIC